MARITVLTFHFSNNSGAMLQAYGLVNAIRELGHNIEILDYRPSSIRKSCYPPLPRNPLKRFRILRLRYKIKKFRSKYLPLTRIFLNSDDISKNLPFTDAIVCGSDQIWNISSPVRGFDPVFFLNFLKNRRIRRVSYAASAGDCTDYGDHKALISNLLSKFDYLSVRDLSTSRVVENLINKKPVHVLDPCFLSDYSSITPSRYYSKPYILLYCSSINPIAPKAISYLQSIFNKPIISINSSFTGTHQVNPGPLEWLSLMKYADFVCTDSFHGTCFSLINSKQFVTLPYSGGMNRLTDILKSVNLENRLTSTIEDISCQIDIPIDYTVVSDRIDYLRSYSTAYLSDALSNLS